MRKSKILIAIPLMAVTLIGIIFASLAWFMGSTGDEVTAVGPSMEAEESAYFTIGEVQTFQNIGDYRGETGLNFYRYVDTTEGDYEYVYYDDGVYEDAPTVEQLWARYNTYYFPYTIADSHQLDQSEYLYWYDEADGYVTPATPEQIEFAGKIYWFDSTLQEYVLAGLGHFNNAAITSYYYKEDEETYVEATPEQISDRKHIYYGTIERVTPDQLSAGRYLYYFSDGVYYDATVAQVDEAKRVLYYVGYDNYDNPVYTMATVEQMEHRMSMRVGETEEIATYDTLLYYPDTVKYYDASADAYSDLDMELREEALRFYYKDRGVIQTKDFTVYSFVGDKWQSGTYYWEKYNNEGATSSKKRYSAQVTAANINSTYRSGTSLYLVALTRKGSSTTVYEIYNKDNVRVFDNYDNKDATIKQITSSTYQVWPGGGTTYLGNNRAFTLMLGNQTENVRTYYMRNTQDTSVQYLLDYDDLNLSNGEPTAVLYTEDGSTRNVIYSTDRSNNTIVFHTTATTVGSTAYAGYAECTKRVEFKEGTCQTITHPTGMVYQAYSKDYILQCTYSAGTYNYKLMSSTGTVLLDSTDVGVTITVSETTMLMYAIQDDATKEDEAYNLSKQFNVAFPASEMDLGLRVGVDKLGVVPLHDEAKNALIDAGATPYPVYYTYVDDGNVNFGLDVVRNDVGTLRETTQVINYDGSQLTEIIAEYSQYDAATDGRLLYQTSTGYQLYINEGDEEVPLYVAADNSLEGMATLAALNSGVEDGSIDLFILSGTRYLEYAARYGDIVYSVQTSEGKRLFYRSSVEATLDRIDEGVGLFTDAGFTRATINQIHASGTLYSDESGTVATAEEIAAWESLFYRELSEGVYFYRPVDFAQSNRLATLYYCSYVDATSAQISIGANLYVRTVNNAVYAVSEGHKGTLLYGEANGHGVSTSGRTIYLLSEETFFDNFYVEVDLYNFTQDIMLGTFYPDDEGALHDEYGELLVLPASEGTMSYRCVVRVYFIDKVSYKNLHDDNKLVFTYSEVGTPSFTVTEYTDIRPFIFSDYMYIGSNFLLRLNILTSNLSE